MAAPLDRYTAAHAAAGALLGANDLPFWAVLTLAGVWCAVDAPIARTVTMGPSGASMPAGTRRSCLTDVLAVVAGYGAARLIPPRTT
jgi:hypothetical protein